MDSPKSFKAKFSRIMLATAAKNESDLARILEIHPSSVGAAKKRNQIPTGWIEKVADDFSINSDWLFFGRGQMLVETSCCSPPRAENLSGDVVLLSIVEARLTATGEEFTAGDGHLRACPFPRDYLLRKGNPGNMVLMRVSGESMEPDICDNDIVLIDRSKTDLFPGRIYAVGFDECVYLRKVDMLPGKLLLQSSNPSFPPMETEVKQSRQGVRILGRVLWCGRDFK